MRFNGNQSGVTLIELMAVLAVASVMFVITVTYSLPWMAQQTLHSALHDAQAFLQLAKIESVSRNRPCRFVVDSDTGALEIWDGMATPSLSDDVLLHEGRVHASVRFDRPTSGADVTLQQIGSSSRYQTIFQSDGMVAAGTGAVHLFGGDRFGRLELFVAGGVQLSAWDGSQWHTGL